MRISAPFAVSDCEAEFSVRDWILSRVGARYAKPYERMGIFSMGIQPDGGVRGKVLNFDPAIPTRMKYRIGHRVWVLLRGQRKWKGTIAFVGDESNSSPGAMGYNVHCDPDVHFDEGCTLWCAEHELQELLESESVN